MFVTEADQRYKTMILDLLWAERTTLDVCMKLYQAVPQDVLFTLFDRHWRPDDEEY